jgi:hypothetical protein
MDPKITWAQLSAPFIESIPAPAIFGLPTLVETGYELRAYDLAGVEAGRYTDFTSLSYVKRVGEQGVLVFGFPGDHKLTSIIQDKWEFEVWRKPPGQDWARDFAAIFRDEDWSYPASGSSFVGYCPGILHKLAWRDVEWPANIINRSKFLSAKAETVAKTLVNYNAAALATTGNGRKRNGAITGLTVQADGASGNTIDWYCHGQGLLESLQGITKIGGGDFDLVRTASNGADFRWYSGQLGTDRSADVKFSMELGNMADPRYRVVRSGERTVANVWGQGLDSDRDYRSRTGANYSTTNNIEFYVDAKDIEKGQLSALDARGDQKLKASQAVVEFVFRVLQTPATLYGVHYFLGDLVTAINPFTGESLILKIIAVAIGLDASGAELVDVEMGTP